jgi:hypothetical protein
VREAVMAKRKKSTVENLVAQLIRNELESQLAKMVRKAKKRAVREAAKLNEALSLEYHKDQGFVEAEVIEPPEEENQ